MGSRTLRPAVLSVLVLLLVAGSAPILAGAAGPSSDVRASEGNTDVVAFGTAWVPQSRSRFAVWRPMGWGTEVKVKASGVGDQWVHIPLPYASVEEGTAVTLYYVEFCAKSSNGAATKPVTMDIWTDAGRLTSQSVAWAANNSRQCWGYTLAAPTWVESLGFSVKLHFASTGDMITLYKAWAHVGP
jgi:hypothetical protein